MLKIFALFAILACLSVVKVDSNPALLRNGFVKVEEWPPKTPSTTTTTQRPASRRTTPSPTTIPPTMTPLELWTYKNNANQRFVRVSEKDWRELDGVKVVATFKEVSRRNDPQRGLVVGLKNDAMNAGQRQFVVLTSDGAYQGPADKGLEKYAEGTWATIQREMQVHDPEDIKLELWVEKMNETHYFEKISSFNWIEYYQGKVIDEYKWISHQIPKREITLKSTKIADKHILLTPTSQFEMSASGFKLTITKLLSEGGWATIGKRWWSNEKWTFSNDSGHFFNHTLEKTWSQFRKNKLYRVYEEIKRSVNPPEVLLLYFNRGPLYVRLSLTNAESGSSETNMREIGKGTFENFSQPDQQADNFDHDETVSHDEKINEEAKRVCPDVCRRENLQWTGMYKTDDDGKKVTQCLCKKID